MERINYFTLGLISLFNLIACSKDIQEEGCCHAYYTLVNKSDYDVELEYFERGMNSLIKDFHDTIIKKDSSYTMEIIWDIIGTPFQRIDTVNIKYGNEIEFKDYKENNYFDIILFSKAFNYEINEKKEHLLRASYTITNADYEYAKQKLEERDRHE